MPVSKADMAAYWASLGYRVFPCHPDVPGALGNDRRAKKPMWEGWTEFASSDPDTVRAWWGSQEFNIGILATGSVIVDVDTKDGKDGLASWAALGMPERPDTFTVRTPSGGLHFYFTGADVALNQGALGRGLDIRSHNGYVLAPGSTIEGVPYSVENPAPMAQAPAVVIAKCKPPGERAANAQEALVDEDDARGIALAVQAIASTPPAIDGERSQRAYELACKVRDFGISEVMCRSLMAAWGASSNVVGDDLHMRISNAYAYAQNASGVKHPDVLFSGTKEVVAMIPAPTLLPPAAVAAERAERSGLRLLSAGDCASAPPRSYVVKNLLAPGQLGCVFGAPGAGKSVLAPHVAYAVAQGRPVFGQRAKAAPVLYVAAEDEAGMQQRVTALRERHGDAPGFHLVVGVSSLLDPASGDLARLQQLVEELRPSLVVVDTLAAACPGLKENEADSMGSAVAALRSLTRNGAAVLAIHHSPKSGDTPRGHSVLNGALDVSIHVIADDAAEGVIQGQLHKNRNGACVLPDGNTIAFRIEAAPLGRDEDGDPVTAPVCAEMTREEARDARKANITKTEAAAEAILVEMGGQAREVPMDDWAARCCEQGAVSKARRLEDRRVTFRKIRDRLRDKIRIRVGRAAGVETVMYLGHGAHETWGDRRAPPASLFPPGIVVPPSPPGGDGVPAQSVQVGLLQ